MEQGNIILGDCIIRIDEESAFVIYIIMSNVHISIKRNY